MPGRIRLPRPSAGTWLIKDLRPISAWHGARKTGPSAPTVSIMRLYTLFSGSAQLRLAGLALCLAGLSAAEPGLALKRGGLSVVEQALALSRIKDLAQSEGVRQNQLIGCEKVVGLNRNAD